MFSTCVQQNTYYNYIFAPDIEGILEKLLLIFKNHNLITDNNLYNIVISKNQHIVFMGDLFDKGIHNKRIAEYVFYLKNKYPNQVTFLLGNRDINKIRYLIEIPKILYFISNQINYDELVQWFNHRIKWITYNKIETDNHELRIKHFIDWWETKSFGAKNKIFYWWKEQNINNNTRNSTQTMSIEELQMTLYYMYDAFDPNGESGIIYKILQFGEVCKVLPTQTKNIFIAHASPFCNTNISSLEEYCNEQTFIFRESLNKYIEDPSSLHYYKLVAMSLDQILRINYNGIIKNIKSNHICYDWSINTIDGIIDITKINNNLLDIFISQYNIDTIILGHKPYNTGKIIKYKQVVNITMKDSLYK